MEASASPSPTQLAKPSISAEDGAESVGGTGARNASRMSSSDAVAGELAAGNRTAAAVSSGSSSIIAARTSGVSGRNRPLVLQQQTGFTGTGNRKWGERGTDFKNAKFSKGESEIVVDAVKRYAKENDISVERLCQEGGHKGDLRGAWLKISECLPGRTVQAIYRHGIRQLHGGKRGPWSEEELLMLDQLVEKHGKKWKMMEKILGRNADNCRDKHRERLVISNNGAWREAEEDKLVRLVQEKVLVPGKEMRWADVAKEMGTRGRIACMRKWDDIQGQVLEMELHNGESRRAIDLALARDVLECGATDESDVIWTLFPYHRASRRWKDLRKMAPPHCNLHQAAKAVIECFESNCSPGQRTAASDSRSRPPRSSMKQPFSNQPRSNQRHAAEKNNADRKKLSGRSSAWSRSSAVGHSFSKLDGEQGRAVAGRAGQKRGSGRLSVVERETSSNKPVADAGSVSESASDASALSSQHDAEDNLHRRSSTPGGDSHARDTNSSSDDSEWKGLLTVGDQMRGRSLPAVPPSRGADLNIDVALTMRVDTQDVLDVKKGKKMKKMMKRKNHQEKEMEKHPKPKLKSKKRSRQKMEGEGRTTPGAAVPAAAGGTSVDHQDCHDSIHVAKGRRLAASSSPDRGMRNLTVGLGKSSQLRVDADDLDRIPRASGSRSGEGVPAESCVDVADRRRRKLLKVVGRAIADF